MLWSGDQSLAENQVGRHSLCCGVGASHWHSIRHSLCCGVGTSHWHSIRLVGISHMG